MNIEGARDVLMGVMQDNTPIEHRDVLRNNLEKQRVQVEEEIMVLEGKLALKKEYLAKIEGGIDVLDELK
tara:strand:+ start:2142 stop:2351 length:210 start_codon:yes stop_codon:yes gene_type:complete